MKKTTWKKKVRTALLCTALFTPQLPANIDIAHADRQCLKTELIRKNDSSMLQYFAISVETFFREIELWIDVPCVGLGAYTL